MQAQTVRANTLSSTLPPSDRIQNDCILIVPGSSAAMPCLTEACLETLRAVAGEFGWSLEIAADFNGAVAACDERRTVAILFHREAFECSCSWTDALRAFGLAFPQSRLIPCHGFSDVLDRTLLTDAGAFHFLWLPIKDNELRQCLGFVWQTRNRPVEANGTRMPVRPAAELQPVSSGNTRKKSALPFRYTAA